jgi:hypothetical protein
MMYRRQKRQLLFGGLLGAIALANALFFVILYQPARTSYFGLKDSIARLQTQAATSQRSVARLEAISVQLEHSDADRKDLFTSHFVSREAGFAALLPLLNEMCARTGVIKNRVNFDEEKIEKYGLETVKIKIPVQGGYSNIVSFIKELENSDTMFIVDTIDVRPGSDSVPGGNGLELNLGLETFFYR